MTTDLKLRVGVIGLGTVGKRVADAVAMQPDMILGGVAVPRPVPAMMVLATRGIPVHHLNGAPADAPPDFRWAGGLEALLEQVDVIADCGPRGAPQARMALYHRAGVRTVVQGGERPSLVEADFCASAGLGVPPGLSSLRVASCNTTGLVRLIGCLRKVGDIANVRAVLVRCAADPDKADKGTPNALVGKLGVSHHAEDVRAFWPDLDIRTLAAYAATNRGHLAALFVRFKRPPDLEAITRQFAAEPRIALLEGGSGSTSDLRDHVGRGQRIDAQSVLVWQEGLALEGDELTLLAAIHMESIVVPDTIDAMRLMARGEHLSLRASIAVTDGALGATMGRLTVHEGLL